MATQKRAVHGRTAAVSAPKKAPRKAVTAVKRPAAKAVAKAATQAPPTVSPEIAKPKKPKLVRDGFTFPESDYALFAQLKKRALQLGLEVKKSELLRGGLRVLSSLDDTNFKKQLLAVERIKTGRPSKS